MIEWVAVLFGPRSPKFFSTAKQWGGTFWRLLTAILWKLPWLETAYGYVRWTIGYLFGTVNKLLIIKPNAILMLSLNPIPPHPQHMHVHACSHTTPAATILPHPHQPCVQRFLESHRPEKAGKWRRLCQRPPLSSLAGRDWGRLRTNTIPPSPPPPPNTQTQHQQQQYFPIPTNPAYRFS